jgi:tetratricopeptide (TPR) repeat protein
VPRVPINGYIDSATTRIKLRCRLLHGPGAEPLVFFTGDGAGILQPFEFLEFIGHAEANHVAQLVASLLDPLVLPLGHAAVLRYQVDEDSQIGEQDQHDDPNRLGPARYANALLRAASGLPEDELQTALARLVASELVFQRGSPPDAVYSFKHALVQDAAHGSLLRGARQQLHAQIAEALEAHSPELMDSQPELFAQHYTEAGLVEKSVACWGKAGHSSVARLAMAEAASQYQKGLDQLVLLPDDRERQRQELEYCSSLGDVLSAVKGHSAPETGHAHARARELWERLGSPSEFLRIPFRQSLHHQIRGEFDQAQRLDEGLLRLSRQRNDSGGLVLGHASSGRTLMFTGRFAPSRSHLEEVRRLLDHSAVATHDSQAILWIVLFCLGYPDQALALSNAAITEARRLAHPLSLAVNLTLGARLLSLVGDDVVLAARRRGRAAHACDSRRT